jgi:hypothetical protein
VFALIIGSIGIYLFIRFIKDPSRWRVFFLRKKTQVMSVLVKTGIYTVASLFLSNTVLTSSTMAPNTWHGLLEYDNIKSMKFNISQFNTTTTLLL